jgi:NAD(P)-dependent dehydrogenase (short-subunit alcohol dehydrogenase family)
MRLEGKTAIVTGAAGNIGLAATKLFVAEGARVLMVDRDAVPLADFAGEFPAGSVETFVADVTKPDEVEAYAARAGELFGSVDAFFNNAGIEGPVRVLEDYPDDGFDDVMAVNSSGVFYGLKHVAPRMGEWGGIVITSSVMGLSGSARAIGYSAAKHAVVGMMRSAAKALAERHIRVNTIHPGMVESAMLRRIQEEMRGHGFDNPEQHYLDAIPFHCLVSPHEIARAVLFLVSDDSRQITGQTLAIDGGYLL